MKTDIQESFKGVEPQEVVILDILRLGKSVLINTL